MRWFIRHPDDRDLNRFADGELGDRELARVSDHLARCPRCRGEVALVRRMGDSARTLPGPLATDEVLRRALARRAAGDRVLLPNSDAGAPPRRPVTRFAPAAIAAMLTLMVASLVVSVRVLEADRPALRLYPERPAAGEALRVDYHGGSLFADQTHLKLRARYRTADDRHWQLLAGILVRDDDGTYRTEVQLPDSVVYAAFAVEDLHGERLDSNNRELWDVMVHRDGRPTLDAMMARMLDLERRDWGEAYQQTLRMTEAYPDAPQSWSTRFAYELGLFDKDSIFAVHTTQYHRLNRAMAESRQPEDGDKMAGLGIYALDIGETVSGAMWIRRSRALDPRSEAGLKGQMTLWAREATTDPKQVMAQVESLWETAAPQSKAVANLGWQLAITIGQRDAIRVWVERYLRVSPEETLTIAPRVYPLLGGDSVGDWVQDHVNHLLSLDGLRPLERTKQEHQRIESEQHQRLLAAMAVDALANADSDRAARLAAAALPLAWESPALLDLSRVLLSTGDPAAALSALARAAADPFTAAAAQELASVFPDITTREWEQRLNSAERMLHDHVLSAAVTSYIDLDMTLQSDSRTHALDDLLGPRATVLAFMSRLCAPALQDLPRLAQLADELKSRGANLVIIDVDHNTAELSSYVREIGISLGVHIDHSGAARANARSSRTPEYFVLDSAGRIRFEHSRLDEVLRQVEALQFNPPPVLAADE